MRNTSTAAVIVTTLLLLCAHAVRAADEADKPKEPPFEKDIKAFEAADAKSPPAKGGIVFVGSSSIRGWRTLAEDFPGLPVINRGFGGSQVSHSVLHAHRIVTPYEPKTIVFYAGDNDINGGKTPERVLSDYKEFVATVREKLPETRIYFISIKPSIARWKLVDKMREANRLVKEFSESEKNLGYIDIFPLMLGVDGQPKPELYVKDGLHMTREGYAVWRDAVKPVLEGSAAPKP